MNILSPSILAADFCRLGEEISAVESAGAQYLHIDVMDGHFVPNITVGLPVVSGIRSFTELLLDVHLMISNPGKFAGKFAGAGADIITFHIETFHSAHEIGALINQIKSYGKKAALAINPKTPVSAVFPHFADLDMVLIMLVEPGFGGQIMIPECLDKIQRARNYANKVNPGLKIEVDGGITLANVNQVISRGADVIVAGSAVFGKSSTGETAENAEKFMKLLI